MAEISSIDDLLVSAQTGVPTTPPNSPEIQDTEASEDISTEGVSEVPRETSSVEEREPHSQATPSPQDPETESEPPPEPDLNLDEYGNEQEKPKLFTKEEMNERINEAVRERLARMERNHQPNQQQVQQQVQQGFQYDSNSEASWDQQLEAFVRQTFTKISQEQMTLAQQQRQQQVQAEFESKFEMGMKRFNDYVDVVREHRVTDAMLMATRGMKDPAAFIYAAAKRAPQELQRISNIADECVQMAEIGKLEEKMKQAKPITKAPKPVSRTPEDTSIAAKSDKAPTIDDLLAKEDAKRRALYVQRRR